ncbi:MAG: HDIG domain-containing protein [Planctomycetota bacterium]|jgi:putative nucleotidyltransferase with HDIG domain|nr:HDIG domain-containing protein [Planctomycetota bacterium]
MPTGLISDPRDRARALEVFRRHNQSPSLFRHALAVEAVMRHFAAGLGEDEDYWGAVGLLHDLDYELYPDRHCAKSGEILRDEGYDEAFIRAVISHGYGLVNEVKPELPMEKVLYAVDELTGLIAAAALMRPSRKLADLEVKSLRKKWRDKRFAAGVDRGVILRGCEMLGRELEEVMRETMAGMLKAAAEIGLDGRDGI